jgi:alpha-galactosidase
MVRIPDQQYQRRDVVKLAASTAVAAAMGVALEDANVDAAPAQRIMRVEDMNIRMMQQGWGRPTKNKSVGGNELSVGGKTYRHGIGTHAESIFRINLKKSARRFTAKVGLDDEATKVGAVIFELVVDGKLKARTPVMRLGEPAREISVNLRGARELTLLVEPGVAGNNYDHADWLDPIITLAPGAKARPVALPPYPGANDYPQIASGDPDTPEFHGPRIFGATPGHDFLFKVPYTGKAPVIISAQGLPAGLTMDNAGLMTGQINTAGEYKVRLTASNAHGKAHRTLRLVAGTHKLAMTPAMGWNSWNAYGMANDAQRTRAAADAMVKSGLASKGFMYINIDDGWQNGRSADGEIKTTDKFGDMKAIADYVHSRGLRFGVYSSPGPKTCGGHTGSFGHEVQDANTYARWGVDYLKYDWCSYNGEVPKHPDLEQFIKPYREMGEALRKSGRDIFFSLCQYGMGHVWTWAGKSPVWGNSARISGDINDSWGSMISNGFNSDGMLFPFAGPGYWNDPDMLVVGWGYFEDGPLHWTHLTPHEQLTHITLWCMLSAPLLLGCDLEKLLEPGKPNKFTLDLMTNTEVLAVNQDELGMQAQRVDRQGSLEVWARPLWDGTAAVAIFNLGAIPGRANIPAWDMVNPVLRPGTRPLHGAQAVRDLWKRKDLGSKATFSARIPPHSAIMLKVGTPNVAED